MFRRNLGIVLLALFLTSVGLLVWGRTGGGNSVVFAAQGQVAGRGSAASAGAVTSQPATRQIVTAYTLPPDRYQKARDLGRIHFCFALASLIYVPLVLLMMLRWKLGAKYRDCAERVSSNRFVQSLIFSPLLLLTIAVFTLPADIGEEWVERNYGLSVQRWGSWSWDWVKSELIVLVIGIILIWRFYAVVRRSPRRWWFYCWLGALPVGLFLFFLQPLVVDPLFHKFELLEVKDPALTASLEQMVQRAGADIPPERIFWMGAGEKTTELNAYVTGFGASKRMVVWDTTIAKMNTPQTVFVAGHEMGHYVLGHIPKLLAFGAVLLLIFFYLAYRWVGWALRRWSGKWGIRSMDDWASLPALLLLLSVLSAVASPIGSAVSRHYEHQADQYGLEVTHGLTPDSGQVAAQSFQILGEVDLSNPEPNPLAVFLFYSHPSIPERIKFSLTYDPWAKGGTGEFVK